MAIRLKILLIIGGGVLAFFGFQEYRLGKDAASQPVTVELGKLEAGEALPNVHAQVGRHFCLYTESVYSCELATGETEPGPGSKLEHIYFPIISDTHPWFQERNAVVARYGGDWEAVPEKEWPRIKQFAVLVKTDSRFDTLGQIPGDWVEGNQVAGLVVNRIRKLSGEERDLVQETFPSADLDKVLILEEGRKPKANGVSLGMVGGGILLILAGLGWMVAGNRG